MEEELCKHAIYNLEMIIKKILPVFLFVILISSISAYTYLNIYIDETGKATFLGETDEKLILPNGTKIDNGVIKGKTQELTNKNKELWTFSYFLKGAELYVVLPKGAVIKNFNGGEIGLEGNQFSIYAQETIDVRYTIEEYNKINFIWIISMLLIFVLIVFLLKKKKSGQNRIEIIKQVLSKREKLILEKIKKYGKIKSSHLRKVCEIPKASFSRHVQELEKKGLIKRTGEGKNKFISLIE